MCTNLAELIEKYGEDNGRYLYEQFTGFQSSYHTLTFIETGLECDSRFEEQARQEAARRGWEFEKLTGDLGLLRRLATAIGTAMIFWCFVPDNAARRSSTTPSLPQWRRTCLARGELSRRSALNYL